MNNLEYSGAFREWQVYTAIILFIYNILFNK